MLTIYAGRSSLPVSVRQQLPATSILLLHLTPLARPPICLHSWAFILGRCEAAQDRYVKKGHKKTTPKASQQSAHVAGTDMMGQYRQVKAQHQDALVFFRFGDFYEMFYDDAAVASRELEITLTSRPHGKNTERVPMCGVPHYRLDTYLTRLVEKGFKVAICEQLEGPQKGKALIQREVVRVVTPGTLFETTGKERTLAAVFSAQDIVRDVVGVAFLSLATGDFLLAETTWANLPSLLAKFPPQEIVLPEHASYDTKWQPQAFRTERPAATFAPATARKVLSQTFGRKFVEPLAASHRQALTAAGALLLYVKETQQNFLPHFKAPQPYRSEEFVFLDPQTQRNLELVENMWEGTGDSSVLSVLDLCHTRMGHRRLRYCLLHPLRSVNAIQQRHEAVATLLAHQRLRTDLQTALTKILDLERLTSRLTSAVANPRDLSALGTSLAPLPQIHALLSQPLASLLKSLHNDLDPLDDIHAEIQHGLVAEPKALAKEGGIIRDGVSVELDELRLIQTDGSGWLARYEQQERKRTTIPNLKVGFNRVFGYYLEVTKSHLALVPTAYTRRQTLVNAERFITPELHHFEDKMLSAADRSKQLEYELFTQLREQVAAQADRLRQTAHVLGMLDVLCAFAAVASTKGWVQPHMTEEYALSITEGRHPVVETHSDPFVPNDLALDEHTHLLILTGPNAAGKSTYARQTALLVLLAQIGSFVPAQAATVSVVDRIFTRVGAADFLAQGLSTFMLEMTETANILQHATDKSLVILDEVGRGTGTSDGQAIAQAVAETLAQEIKAKTLFTTHYHELAQLAQEIPGIANARLAVREEQDDVTFLYKVVPGAAQKSYGLYVAKLAGLPPHVVQRAKDLLATWQEETPRTVPELVAEGNGQGISQRIRTNGRMPLRAGHPLLERLAGVDPLHTTPMDALGLVAELKKLADGIER